MPPFGIAGFEISRGLFLKGKTVATKTHPFHVPDGEFLASIYLNDDNSIHTVRPFVFSNTCGMSFTFYNGI